MKLCRLISLFALLAALGLGCSSGDKPGTTPTPTDDAEGDGTDNLDNDGSADSGHTDADTKADDVKDSGTLPGDTIADVPDGSVPDVAPGTDGTATTDPDTKADGDATVGPDVFKKALPLDICAGSPSTPDSERCKKCGLCAEQPICVTPDNGTPKTYKNDCFALCDLMLYDGLTSLKVQPGQKACPACKFCNGTEAKKEFCVTLNSGAVVTVEHECEILCQDFKPKADGKPTVSAGACKSTCSQPTPTGGGCNFSKYSPVCAKEDGKTYSSVCAMQHCDLPGCFAAGSAAATANCKSAKMNVECAGECFDATKTPNCSSDCAAVCGILKNGKGQSFRNDCVAKAAGATTGSCAGVTEIPGDEKCSAALLYNGIGCWPDVDYTDGSLHPVCGSRPQTGKPDQWVTFRSAAEFKAFAVADPTWTQKYPEACKCTCDISPKEVCGDDGVPYINACVAECYNPGGKFGYKPGKCP